MRCLLLPQIELTVEQKTRLLGWSNGRKSPVRLAERAGIVLLASEGQQDLQIASELSITPKKAAGWRQRFLDKGLAGLEKDAPRPGRNPSIANETVAEAVRLTTQQKYGNAAPGSTRTMAAAEGISDSSVLRIWHAHGLKPHRAATFKVSNGPGFSQNLEAIVGQYLNRPAHAIVLCVDEKDQVQALGDGHSSQSEPQKQFLGRLPGKCGPRELGIPLTSDHMRARQVSSGPH